MNSNCTGVRPGGWTPAAAESHPAANTGRRPSAKGSDDAAAHSIQPTPDARRRPRGAAATTPNWHPTTAPDREASAPIAGDGIGAANVASNPFDDPKTPPAPGIAAGGIACSSTAGWTYSKVHVGSSASVNTRSWSYPRCVALPSSASGGVGGGDDDDDDTAGGGGGALAFWGGTGRGVRVILVAGGIREKSRRLSETVTPTTPSRRPAGSTQRTFMDAGAFGAPASASPVVSFTGTARRPATGPTVPALHQIWPSAPGTPRFSPRIVATDPPVTGARRG